MITGIGLVCVNVLDMDVARDFYVDTLGFEVSFDMVHDGFHCFVVHPPSQPEVPLMLVVPGPPVVDEETAAEIRITDRHRLPGARCAGDGRLLGDVPRARGQGRGVHRAAGGALLRHRRRLPRSRSATTGGSPSPSRWSSRPGSTIVATPANTLPSPWDDVVR